MEKQYKYSRICHEHFTEDQYTVKDDGSRRLVKGSVPTLKLPRSRKRMAVPASASVTRIPYKQVSQHLEKVASPPTSPVNPLSLMQPSTPVPTHSLLSTPTSAQSQARILTVRPGVTVKPGSRYLLTPQGKLIPHTVTPSTPSMAPQLQVIPRTVNLGATVTLQPTKPMVNLIPQTVTPSKPSRIPKLRVVPRSAGVPTSSLKPTKVKQSTPVTSETTASTDLTKSSQNDLLDDVTLTHPDHEAQDLEVDAEDAIEEGDLEETPTDIPSRSVSKLSDSDPEYSPDSDDQESDQMPVEDRADDDGLSDQEFVASSERGPNADNHQDSKGANNDAMKDDAKKRVLLVVLKDICQTSTGSSTTSIPTTIPETDTLSKSTLAPTATDRLPEDGKDNSVSSLDSALGSYNLLQTPAAHPVSTVSSASTNYLEQDSNAVIHTHAMNVSETATKETKSADMSDQGTTHVEPDDRPIRTRKSPKRYRDLPKDVQRIVKSHGKEPVTKELKMKPMVNPVLTENSEQTFTQPHRCVVKGCSYQAIHKETLALHMAGHKHGLQENACSKCFKVFDSSIKLQLHQELTCAKTRPYRCVVCKVRFRHEYALLRHKLTHDGDKPFKCTICDYESTQNSNLTTHMRKHSGDKPYKCPLCSYAAAHNVTLKGHTLKEHGKTLEELRISKVKLREKEKSQAEDKTRKKMISEFGDSNYILPHRLHIKDMFYTDEVDTDMECFADPELMFTTTQEVDDYLEQPIVEATSDGDPTNVPVTGNLPIDIKISDLMDLTSNEDQTMSPASGDLPVDIGHNDQMGLPCNEVLTMSQATDNNPADIELDDRVDVTPNELVGDSTKVKTESPVGSHLPVDIEIKLESSPSFKPVSPVTDPVPNPQNAFDQDIVEVKTEPGIEDGVVIEWIGNSV